MHKVNSHEAKTNLWAASAPTELSREKRNNCPHCIYPKFTRYTSGFFDRILVTQATVEGITLLTSDAIVAQYLSDSSSLISQYLVYHSSC